MKQYLLLAILFVTTITTYSQSLTKEEKKLYNLIMKYRAEKGLPSIPISPSLNIVAHAHVRDLQQNNPNQKPCNMHSWSANGKWTPCCYTPDHAQAQCMWDKPKELTSYQGTGYEVACRGSNDITAEEALKSWKESPGHNAIIINQNVWKSSTWNAIGIGLYKKYSVVWFGEEKDQKIETDEAIQQVEKEATELAQQIKIRITIPKIFVKNIKETIAFYKILGFKTDTMEPNEKNPSFVLMTCGGSGFMFQTFSSLGNDLPQIKRQNGGSLLLYIDIKGIRLFYKKIKDKVKIIKGLEKTTYGTTEFSIVDNNSYILTFAESE